MTDSRIILPHGEVAFDEDGKPILAVLRGGIAKVRMSTFEGRHTTFDVQFDDGESLVFEVPGVPQDVGLTEGLHASRVEIRDLDECFHIVNRNEPEEA